MGGCTLDYFLLTGLTTFCVKNITEFRWDLNFLKSDKFKSICWLFDNFTTSICPLMKYNSSISLIFKSTHLPFYVRFFTISHILAGSF